MRAWGPELLIVALIILLLFGANRLPKLARSMRQARDEFEKGKAGDETPEPESTEQPKS